MKASTPAPANIDEYIAGFPREVRKILEEVRSTIRKAVPHAAETISYGMPTFTLNGHVVVHFGGYRRHLGLYPAPIDHPDFAAELAPYASGKGTAKFALDSPIPYDLIARIAQFRVKENAARRGARGTRSDPE